MIFFYDKDGNPLPDMAAWVKLYEDFDYRRIAFKSLSPNCSFVSTIWTGMDRSWEAIFDEQPNPHPWIFETVVMIDGRTVFEQIYTTEEEAVADFDRMVTLYSFDERPEGDLE